MKTRKNLLLDRPALVAGVSQARALDVSLSELVSNKLKLGKRPADGKTFSQRWRGSFLGGKVKPDARLDYLLEKYQ